MWTPMATVFVMASLHATTVGAQHDQCLELVRLSRMKTQTVMNQSQFRSTVNAYCDERSDSSAEAGSAGVSGYFSASASRAEASYGKFCSKDTDDRGSESDYQEYMEGVQPGAYAAYAACTAALNNDGIQFEMAGQPVRDRLSVAVYNRTDSNATADMEWNGSDPVTCQWSGRDAGTPKRTTLEPNERTVLECRRSSFNSEPLRDPDAVDIFRADGGTAPALNIPWPKYEPDGDAVQTLDEIRQQLDTEVARLQSEVNALTERARDREVHVQTGEIRMHRREHPDLIAGRARAPQRRGITDGRVTFVERFASTPQVLVALKMSDSDNRSNARIEIEVTAVDSEGFSYRFATWDSTRIYQAAASWMAVAE